MSKTYVVFHLGRPEAPFAGVPAPRLPLEVRKPNLIQVTRGLTNQVTYLEPGVYFVTVTLPDGRELTDRVRIEETSIEVFLGQDRGFSDFTHSPYLMRPALYARFRDNHVGYQGEGSFLQASNEPRRQGVKLRLFRQALPWQTDPSIITTETSLRLVQEDELSWRVEGLSTLPSRNSYLMQLIQRDSVPTNLLFSKGEQDSACKVLLVQQPGSKFCLNTELANADANVLLTFLGMGRLREAATMTASDTLTAEALLRDKREDPMAAAVGAYALLRLGDLDQLHDWTENLRNWFSWLSDGLTIRGEHLARLGEHEKAMEAFLELPLRGLPLFSEGFSNALNRLRSYLSIPQAPFSQQQINQAEEVLSVLQRFEPYVDTDRPFLSFTGLDPESPDRMVLDEERWLYLESLLHL